MSRAESQGSIVVDELIVPIVNIYLDHGMIVFVGHLKGPVRAVNSANYVINDRSGRTVFRAVGINPPLRWPEVNQWSTLDVKAPASFIGRIAHGSPGGPFTVVSM